MEEKGKSISSSIAACVTVAILGYIFLWVVLPWVYPQLSPSTFIFPFTLLVAIYTAKAVIRRTLSGAFLPNLMRSLTCVAWGPFLFTIFTKLPPLKQLGPVGWLSLHLAGLGAAYELLAFAARRHPFFSIPLKTSAMLVAALIARTHLAGIQSTLADMVYYGLLLSASACALSALALSKNPYLFKTGKWLGSWTAGVFLIGALGALYFLSLRERLAEALGPNFPIAEWGLVSSAVGLSLAGLHRGVKRMSEPVKLADWMKHRQVVGTRSEKELDEVSELVNDFVENGDKSGIVVYLASVASENGIDPRTAASCLRELLEYRDKELPWLVTRRVAAALEMENREERKRVLSRTVELLQSLSEGPEVQAEGESLEGWG